ncbi:MAG: trypsin-like peptidase domain-containing protein [Planctomycetes bacterium]|nr:trypsin-like peptidase domain-containing protein [Planctomycetota bacterium]
MAVAAALMAGIWGIKEFREQGNPGFLLQRALARTQAGELDAAMADLNQAIRASSQDPLLYLARAEVHERRADLDGGIADLSLAIERAPSAWDRVAECSRRLSGLHLKRGIVQQQVGDSAGAIRDFDASIRLAPAQVDGYVRRADALRNQGAWPAAIADYESALLVCGPARKPEFLCLRGEARQQYGDLAGAISDYKQALSTDAKNVAARRNLDVAIEHRARLSIESMRHSVVLVAARTGDDWLTGSGFIVSASGRVITNAHVAKDAEEIRLIWDRSTGRPAQRARILTCLDADDAPRDLALLQIESPGTFPACEIGFEPAVGDAIIVFGFPLGSVAPGKQQWSVDLNSSRGSISAIKVGDEARPVLIQTDARASSGNSGGPVFDIESGKVVGIISCGRTHAGDSQNFAIHAAQLRATRLVE